MIRDARNRRENGYREIQCNQCDHKYRWATMLQRYIESEHERNPLEEITIPLQEEDDGDQREYAERSEQSYHEEADMRNMRQRFKCDDCGFTTSSDYVLEAHKKFTHKLKVKTRAIGTKRKTCEDCGKRINKDSTFKKHRTTTHGVVEVEK